MEIGWGWEKRSIGLLVSLGKRWWWFLLLKIVVDWYFLKLEAVGFDVWLWRDGGRDKLSIVWIIEWMIGIVIEIGKIGKEEDLVGNIKGFGWLC